MITPDLRHFRAFVAVAEELHFGRAAARLNVVQPAVSAQIRALEDLLGVALFHRNRRGVALTEPGRLFLDEARRVLGQVTRAVDLVQRAGRGEAGRLTIGYSAATAYSGLLSTVVGAFHRDAPAVEIALRELHPALQREALLTGELDVAFVVADAASRGPGFVGHVVEYWDMVLALPAGHPLATAERTDLEGLRDEKFITYVALGEILGVDAFRLAAGFTPAIGHRADNPVMLLSMVAAGLGFAAVPAAMRNTAIPGVVFRSAGQRLPRLCIVALFGAGTRSAVLQRFIDLLPEPVSG